MGHRAAPAIRKSMGGDRWRGDLRDRRSGLVAPVMSSMVCLLRLLLGPSLTGDGRGMVSTSSWPRCSSTQAWCAGVRHRPCSGPCAGAESGCAEKRIPAVRESAKPSQEKVRRCVGSPASSRASTTEATRQAASVSAAWSALVAASTPSPPHRRSRARGTSPAAARADTTEGASPTGARTDMVPTEQWMWRRTRSSGRTPSATLSSRRMLALLKAGAATSAAAFTASTVGAATVVGKASAPCATRAASMASAAAATWASSSMFLALAASSSSPTSSRPELREKRWLRSQDMRTTGEMTPHRFLRASASSCAASAAAVARRSSRRARSTSLASSWAASARRAASISSRMRLAAASASALAAAARISSSVSGGGASKSPAAVAGPGGRELPALRPGFLDPQTACSRAASLAKRMRSCFSASSAAAICARGPSGVRPNTRGGTP
mmetsp:Transcript_18998/g.63635  ORF Transcript_18998/g.63635 Transcript_18998/m.63635 type:complete len:441 (+) Transcript_18998:97-1419(+)